MVLGQHGVRWIRTVIIVEDNQLLILTALNDLRRASIQFGLDLVNDWYYEWSEEREDKNIDLLLDLLNESGQDWDFLNRFSD